MPKNAFSWLHLTDFHYGLKGQDCLWPTLRGPFLESLRLLHDRCGPWDAVFFTGDLVQSGQSAQFAEMQAEVLDPIWERLRELGSGGAALLAVPGNHDLFRPNPKDDNPTIDALLAPDNFKAIQEKFWDPHIGSYRRAVNETLAAYGQWWQAAPHRPAGVKDGILTGDFSATLACGDRRIGLIGVNTTSLQLADGDYEGKLVWDARQVHAVCEGGVDHWLKQHDLCLLLTHQGPNWLTPEARKHGESNIAPAGRFAVHLFGHQHETELTYIHRGASRFATRLCQGCSVFGMEKFGNPPVTQRSHGYAAGRIEFGETETTLRLWPRIATNRTGPWRFIPDGENAELETDEGTAPETVAVSSKAAGTRAKPPAVVAALPPSVPVPAAPHSTLPAKRPFFGRTKDLEKIAGYLRPEDRSWGVVLDGPGGVGKTALALEAAHAAPAEHFPLKLWITAKNRELRADGEHQLTDHRVEDYHALLNELGRALGRDDTPRAIPEERPALIRHALAGYRALLVLDNLETFSPEDRRRLFELLGNLPSTCRAIVTSRRRTDGSTAAHNLRLDKLERDAADELLGELGKRMPPVARLTSADRDRLYAETGGNPLLLTWVAGQLGRTTGRSRTIDEAVERLQEAHRLQKLDGKNDPLDYVFGDLVETFTADETAVLVALVHFTQPAPLAWLLPLTELSAKAAETALDGLRDRALLVEDDVAATWLLPPLAAGFLRRVRPEAVGASGERLADQAYALAVENGYDEFERFPVLEAAWPQIAAALPLLLAGDNRRLQTACDALEYFLDFTGRWDDWLSLSVEAESRALHVKNFYNAGWRAYQAGCCHQKRAQAAVVHLCAERAAAHWGACKAGATERAGTISLRGHGYLSTREYPAAIAAYREALQMHRSVATKSRGEAIALNNLAEALIMSGELDEAEVHCREGLTLAIAFEFREGVAALTGNLADLALRREQWSEAERLAHTALGLSEELGRMELIASDCQNLAMSMARQGRRTEGRSHAERAVSLFTELRSPGLAGAQAVLKECVAD